MKHIRIVSLYSGSTGNSFLISDGETSVLIDAGKNCKRLCNALRQIGVPPETVSAVFITHEHSDHISALSVFLKKYPMPVHLCRDCLWKLEADPAIAPYLVPHEENHTETVGSLRLTSFPTPHDSRGSVGYRVETELENGVFSIGYATDIGYVSKEVKDHLTGCQAVILESNHDPEMLKYGPYPMDLKRRIASRHGHLSNPDSADFASELCRTGTKSLMLAHLSQENNTPDTAFDACFCAIGDENIHLCVADPEEVTELPVEVC